ncbi:MAG: ABC transporter ATP-binding protein, partial [Blautia sp.]|nr:ABC transporter ATP-binding protein [Blautia sp.]
MDQFRLMIAKLKKIVISPSLSSIWNWTAGYRKGLFWVSMGNIVAALLGLGYSLVIRGMVDNATDIDSKVSITYACSMILIFLLQLLLSYVMGIREVELTARMTHEMREKILAATLNKKYEELSGYHSAEMASRMMRDTSTVTAGVVEIIPSLLCLATQFTGAFFI